MSNIYFDIIKETLNQMIEQREQDVYDHENKIKELECSLAELKTSQAAAAKNGKDKEYVSLCGKIAVAEAALNSERMKPAAVISKSSTDVIEKEINKVYAHEIGSRARNILQMCDSIMRNYDEMNSVFEEMFEVSSLFDSIAGGLMLIRTRTEVSELVHARKYAESVLDPYVEHPANNSVRGWTLGFNYVEGDELEITTDYTYTDEDILDGEADGDEIDSLEDGLNELSE